MTTTTPTSGASPRTLPRSPTPSPDEPAVLTLWTADPALAARADAAGVDRIGVDLERAGKAERQRGLGTWISPHRARDLDALRPALRTALLFARVNPVHDGTAREVETVLAAGVRVLMVPMVVEPDDAARVAGLVAGRAHLVLLVEHAEALRRLDGLLAVPGVGEVHVGLNDLALSLGLPSRWLALADGAVAEAGRRVREAGLRFGLGGIARVDDADLPVPADLVYAEHARTGSTAALVSRSFLAGGAGADLAGEVARARARLADWRRRDPAELEAAHEELCRRARLAARW
jgi:2-keto-3-deoxy-L-rhamnonate aldolase RhmA